MTRTCLTLTLVAAAACSKGEGGGKSDKAPGSKGAPDAAAATPKPAAMPRLYFTMSGNHVVVGDASGYRKVGDPAEQYFAVTGSPDGGAWMRSKAGLLRYDGAKLTTVDAPGLDEPAPVAVEVGGALWVRTKDKIGRHDGKAWTTWTAREAGATTDDPIAAVEIAADGTAYAITRRELLIGKNSTWTAVAAPAALELRFLAVTGAGEPVMSAKPLAPGKGKEEGRILGLSAGAMVELGKTAFHGAATVAQPDGSVLVESKRVHGGKAVDVGRDARAIGADGTVYGTDGSAITARAAGARPQRHPAKGTLEFRVNTLVADDKRLWVLLDSGMAVLEGGTMTLLPSGTIPELRDRVQRIERAGPGATLPPFPTAQRFELRGRFVDAAGKPAAGVKVELCPGHDAVYYGKSPCDGKQPAWRASSGADGTFAIADIPGAGLAINYKRGKEWTQLLQYKWKNDGNTRTLEDIAVR